MKRFLMALLALIGLLASSVGAPPRVLIVPKKPKDSNSPSPEASLAGYLAQELTNDGRVQAIVWGLADPIFRDAALEGKVGDVTDYPTQAEAMKVAKALGATFMVVYESKPEKEALVAQAELFPAGGGKRGWVDQRSVGQMSGGKFDRLGSAASIARTWSVLLIQGPFKAIVPPLKVTTPKADPGEATPPPTAEAPRPSATQPVAKVDLEKGVESLRRSGFDAQAVVFLRNQVDLNPLDPEPRKLLVKLLVDLGDVATAADEARRAAELMPTAPEFRRLAIQSLMQTNQLAQAREAVNAMLAREGARPEILTLSAEVDLRGLKPEPALASLDRAIQSEPTGERFYLRALVRAMLGGEDGLKRDLDVAGQREGKPSEEEIRRRYRIAAPAIRGSLLNNLKGMSSFIQRVAVRPKDTEVRGEWERLRRECESRTAFLALTYGANHHRKSHDQLALAHQLLKLVLLDLQSYMDGNEEGLTDSRINLGEALRQATGSQAKFDEEVSGKTEDGRPH